MSLPQIIHWLTHTPVNTLVMDYRWTWPISESLHFCGLVLMTGTVGAFDLRVLGLGKGIAPAALHRSLRFGIAGSSCPSSRAPCSYSGSPISTSTTTRSK